MESAPLQTEISAGFEPIERIMELVADRAGLHPAKAADLVWQAIETGDVRLLEGGRVTRWRESDAAGAAQRDRAAWRQAGPAARYHPLARRRGLSPRSLLPVPASGRQRFACAVHVADIERGLERLQVSVSLLPASEPSPATGKGRRRGRPPVVPWDDLK